MCTRIFARKGFFCRLVNAKCEKASDSGDFQRDKRCDKSYGVTRRNVSHDKE